MINKKVELKRIIFKKLLGRFDYNIELKDKLTILTGPNGFGKSTILKTIEAISRGVEGISYFNSLNFEEIIFDFKNYEDIRIRKENKTMYIRAALVANYNIPSIHRDIYPVSLMLKYPELATKLTRNNIGDPSCISRLLMLGYKIKGKEYKGKYIPILNARKVMKNDNYKYIEID